PQEFAYPTRVCLSHKSLPIPQEFAYPTRVCLSHKSLPIPQEFLEKFIQLPIFNVKNKCDLKVTNQCYLDSAIIYVGCVSDSVTHHL
ncbi:hypothetical protein, partial [Microseira wollei]|uniref:hypothetical protein n=1 Tax=Microseira wollei TaxID=467598 RepID=UPI001CFE5CEA